MVLTGRRNYVTLFEEWSEAVNARDSAALARLHAPGGVFLPPDGLPIKGPAMIRQSWREMFSKPRLALDLGPIEAVRYPSEDIASGNATYFLGYDDVRGPIQDEGRLLVIAVKTGGDRWGIRFDAFFSEAYLRELSVVRTLEMAS